MSKYRRFRVPGVCQTCRAPVLWTGKSWKDFQPEGSHRNYSRHVCPSVRDFCGTWMPVARERCARRYPHTGDHKTRYALDNAAAAKAGLRDNAPGYNPPEDPPVSPTTGPLTSSRPGREWGPAREARSLVPDSRGGSSTPRRSR